MKCVTWFPDASPGFRLQLTCLLDATLPPQRGVALLAFRNCGLRQTLPPTSSLGHGISSQQQENNEDTSSHQDWGIAVTGWAVPFFGRMWKTL